MQAEYYTDEKGGQHMKIGKFSAQILKLPSPKFAALPISNKQFRWKQVPGYTIAIKATDCFQIDEKLESCILAYQKDKISEAPSRYKPYQIKS